MSIESKLAFLQETKAANAQTKAYQRLQLLFDPGTAGRRRLPALAL